MAPTAEKVKVTVHEKEFEVEIQEKQGKSFAKTHINNFGEVTVPDFGGGRAKALENIQARIGNILRALQADENREARRKALEEELLKKPEEKPA
jgi:hypothetical protein